MPDEKDIEARLISLADCVEKVYGAQPQRIVVEPAGERDVNCRIGWRIGQYPTALLARRPARK